MNKNILSAIALSFAASAYAQGVYVGGAIGAIDADVDCTVTLHCDNTSTGGRVFAGYKVNEFVAAEIGYMNLGKGNATFRRKRKTIDLSVRDSGITFGVAGFMPIASQWTGFGRLGAYVNQIKTTVSSETGSRAAEDTDIDIHAGIGVGFQATNQLSIDAGLDYTHLTFERVSSNVFMYSIGLRYNF